MVQIARGTPHGRDRERWGGDGGRGRDGGGGGRGGGRRFSPEQRGHYERYERPTTTGRASWLEKYGPPERTDYREEEEEDGDNNNLFPNAGIFIRIL